ncbi:MAG: radical SAM protein [Phocaeicola sp.]
MKTKHWRQIQLYIIINPTLNCNFKCWYCYETHERNSKISFETVQSIKKYIQNELNTNCQLKSIRIDWFGGEPLIYKEIVYSLLSDLHEISKNTI